MSMHVYQLSRLATLLSITLSPLALAAPGGVASGLQFWFKADGASPVNGSNNYISLTDESGNQPAWGVTGDPRKVYTGLNFNPYIEFDGNDYFWSNSGDFSSSWSAGDRYVVIRSSQQGYNEGDGTPFDVGLCQSCSNEHYTWSNQYFYSTFGTTERKAWHPWSKNVIEGGGTSSGPSVETRNWNLLNTWSATNNWAAEFNSIRAYTDTASATNFSNPNAYVGAHNGYVWNGDATEGFVYNRVLSADERSRVNSYLGIKYGVTQGNNSNPVSYKNSSSTVIWSADGSYQNHIAGIGRDDASPLDQRIGKSVQSGAVLTVSTDSDFSSANSSHANTLTNNQFLLWGSNGASTTSTQTSELPGGYSLRIPREWKVVNTGSVGAVNLKFEGIIGASYQLLGDADGNFASGASLLGSSTDGTFTNITLPAGTSYLTLAVTPAGPGGVFSTNQANGIAYSFYSGYDSTPENGISATLLSTGYISGLSHPDDRFLNERGDTFSMEVSARLQINTAGNYTFAFDSLDDDGALYIDGVQRIAASCCGNYNSASIYLSAGQHNLLARFSENGGGETLNIRYYGPDTGNAWWDIPQSRLYVDNPQLGAWFRADSGVISSGNNTTASQWYDQSLNANNLSTTSGAPVYHSSTSSELLNFNPTVNFTDDAMRSGDYVNGLAYDRQGRTTFAIARPSNNSGNNYITGYGRDNTTSAYYSLGNVNGTLRSAGWGNDMDYGGYWNVGQYRMVTLRFESYYIDNSLNAQFFNSGSLIDQETHDWITQMNDNADLIIGGLNDTSADFSGNIAEVIHYPWRLTDSERNRVESYLAIKYGMQLNHVNDYFNSASSSVFDPDSGNSVNAANNGSRDWHDIAGIGRDDSSTLNQRISRSINATANVTVSTDNNFTSPNSSHANVLNNGQYLVWGHDNRNISQWRSDEVDGTQYVRILREWKVENTGDVGNVYFQINTENGSANIANLPAGASRYVLLVDDDGDFSNGASTVNLSNTSGNLWSAGINFDSVDNAGNNDGTVYFTIAADTAVNINFATSASSVTEQFAGVKTHDIAVTSSFAIANTVNFSYSTADGSATAPADYDALNNVTGSIAANATSTSINVNVAGDSLAEGNETFSISIIAHANKTAAPGTQAVHTVTIDESSSDTYVSDPFATSNVLETGETGSSSNPFTSPGAARSISSAGTYYFNINGQAFSTYVDANGWILVASGSRSTGGAYTQTSALTLQSDQTLPSAVFSNAFGSINQVRMTATAGTTPWINMTSSNGTVLSRLRSYSALSYSNNENTWWSGTGAQHTISCNGGTDSLNRRVYHGCGNGSAPHWIPVDSNESVNCCGLNNDLNLWVRAPATNNTGPQGLRLWLKPDSGLIAEQGTTAANGDRIATWQDASGFGRNVVSDAGKRPRLHTNSFNFNSGVRFFSRQALYRSASDIIADSGNDNISIFAAVKRELITSGNDDVVSFPGSLTGTNDRPALGFDSASNRLEAVLWNGSGASYTHSQDLATGVPLILAMRMDATTSTDNLHLSVNGVGNEQSFSTTAFQDATSPLVIGAENNNFNEGFYGLIAEVLIYNSALSQPVTHQISSYLALKYGITLDIGASSYINAAQAVVFDMDDNSDRVRDWDYVAGIFKDSTFNANQRIALSQSLDAKLTVSTDANFSGKNSEHADTLSDQQYLVWGATTDDITATSSNVGAAYISRSARQWKVHNTNNVGTVNLWFAELPALATGQEYVLISSNSNNFSGAVTALGTSSNGVFTDVTFPNGESYFSVAIANTTAAAPGLLQRAAYSLAEGSVEVLSLLLGVSQAHAEEIDLNSLGGQRLQVNILAAKAQSQVLSFAIHDHDSAPAVADYQRAGIQRVTHDNRNFVNDFIRAGDTQHIHIVSDLDDYIQLALMLDGSQQTAVLTLQQYDTLNITGVTSANISNINEALSSLLSEGPVDLDALQALVDGINAEQAIHLAIQYQNTGEITLSLLSQLGSLSNLHTEYLNHYQAAFAAIDLSEELAAQLQMRIDSVNRIFDYANSMGEATPLLSDFNLLGFSQVSADNLEAVLQALRDTGSLDSLEQLSQTITVALTPPPPPPPECQSEQLNLTPEIIASAGLVGIDCSNLDAFETAYLEELENFTSLADIQQLINELLASLAALAEVLEDSSSTNGQNNANDTAVSMTQLQAIRKLEGLVPTLEIFYQAAIAAETDFSDLPTLEQMLALVDATNRARRHIDSDGDGLGDVLEVQFGYDPADADNPLVDGGSDGDLDRLTAAQEHLLGLDDLNPDGDASTTATANEAANGIGDAREDLDGDALPNLTELIFGSNPLDSNDPLLAGADNSGDGNGNQIADNVESFLQLLGINDVTLDSDFDSDGISDVSEIAQGSDPRAKPSAQDNSATETGDAPSELTVGEGIGATSPLAALLLLLLWGIKQGPRRRP